MQNNISPAVDLEFEISGAKMPEFIEWENNALLNQDELQIAKTIHLIILKSAWELVSIDKLRSQIVKQLTFIDLVKVKLDFGENLHGSYWISEDNLTNNLFGWVYYNENDNLKMLRFILNISTGEVKYLNNN